MMFQNRGNINESMLSSMSNGVITIDEDGKIVTCNKSGLKIFKTTENNILESKSEDFFKDKNSWIEEKIKITKETKEADIIMDAEIEIKDPDTIEKETISVNLTILPLINEDSEGRTDEKILFRYSLND